MKKLLLSAAFVASTLTTFAQNEPQVPNGDFETWDVFSGCEDVDSAAHYSTLDEQFYADLETCLPNQSVSKTTSSHSGTYALKMIPLTIASPLGTVYYGSYAALADTVYGTTIPFTGRPTKLKGYYNLTAAGTDAFTISVGTFIKDAEDALSYGDFTTSTSTSGYQAFEIILDYDATMSANPDSLFLTFSLANASGLGSPNSFVYIDDLTFEYETTTSTVNYSATSAINVYAANRNINFSENVSDVHVVDMVGAQKIQETSTTKTLNAASLTTGMYIVTYKYNDAYYSKKVVIE